MSGWQRDDWSGRHGARWTLKDGRVEGLCFYLPGSRRYQASGSVRVGEGAIFVDGLAGTAVAAMRAFDARAAEVMGRTP